ncbi:hypothetical protein BO82DRAFT_184452 [Aspergillus uvarum CBS 121591]|uniref:Uncharacterized protein n=1 Tax=Aspergillus uvarum CBS 121591 TaxID=1448315 RepID=A0A319CJM7_9EURO|nr:hypothetical protein BO82DRAFT_184452 [Aspergillus uvarum CBS 121591]PYH85424.1 hypothetical protein BO82DRAFT_184452 [Aspergillus uvarum CBS 121591]
MPSIPSINEQCLYCSLYYLPVIYSSLTDGLCVAVLRDKFPDSPELQIAPTSISEPSFLLSLNATKKPTGPWHYISFFPSNPADFLFFLFVHGGFFFFFWNCYSSD